MARVALENERGALQKLSLVGQRKRPQAGQLAQAQRFYANALSDSAILDKLAAFGITQAILEAGQRQLDAVAEADAARRQRQGAARDATRSRDAALAALSERTPNISTRCPLRSPGRVALYPPSSFSLASHLAIRRL